MKKLLFAIMITILSISLAACSLPGKDAATSGNDAGNQQDDGETGFVETGDDEQNSGDAGEDRDIPGDDGGGTDEDTKMIKVALYFPTIDNSALKKVEKEIPVVNKAILKACMLALIEGPGDPALRKPIPPGTEILGISIKDGTAIVDLSKEFLNSSGLDEVTSRLSIVNTLTEIEGVDRVRLRIEGEDMAGPSGKPLGDMEPARLDEEGRPLPGKTMTVVLYFSDNEAMYLVGEPRDIEIPAGVSPEEAVLAELMAGPRNDDLWDAIPDGTKLLSVDTKDGVCTVNFSREYIENSPGGTAAERMAIFSVVNTLTELEGIDKVQFLVEGRKEKIYTHAIFDEPFSRDESIISKQ
ncbi:MAG TPA: GerMN domain-containing protein [Clostridiales bacterium]|nr:GerMN domain-containing protein [Clostridiales bacterium]HOL90818.1 GerMN domain-containing protein [Clostridiales bacterium]HPP34748.1 GerMN domain-containing protein [Clostridiales bacterium]